MSTTRDTAENEGPDVEEEELEEVEVTDDETEEQSEAPSTPVKVESSTTPLPTPGKVKPSKAVKDMKMKSPEAHTPKRASGLSPDKNPFPAHGNWTQGELSAIKIEFPVLTGKNETTNELTRKTRPEARYWKAPIAFKYSSFTSDTIKFENVSIPYHTGKNYGSSFVYMCLPGFAADAFAEAGKTVAPTRVTETSLAPDRERWWKIANNVENSFGVINNETKKFHVKNLETIFESTNSGITCSVVLRFYCKASTTETEPVKPTTVRTVSAEVVRAYISAVDVNVQMPTRLSRQKPKAEPTASSKDIAGDSLMGRLKDLGL